MTEIEKLARDICWAEFSIKPEGVTKSAYWRRVHPDKQIEYCRDAGWLVFIAKTLKTARLLTLVNFKAVPAVRRRRAVASEDIRGKA